ncbi:MAG: ROK family protein [Culicoidibacterales bacterium]
MPGINRLTQNQLNIIAVLNKKGPLSRKKLAQLLKLTPASITQQTATMIQLGLLFEQGETPQEERKVGRKEILLALKYESRKLLGIDIESSEVQIGITDLQGKTIASSTFEFNALTTNSADFDYLIAKTTEIVEQLYQRHNISKAELLYCGIGVIGSQFVSKRHSTQPLAIIGKYSELEASFEHSLQLPVKVENNVRALALAEGEFHERDQISNFVFIKIGPKIGSAIIMNNALIRGESDSAGELGYFRVDEYYPENEGALNFEDIISLEFYLTEYQDNFNSKQTPKLYELAAGERKNIQMNMILESLKNRDQYTLHIFTKKMKILALFLHNIQILLDLKKVYIFLTFDQDLQGFQILKKEAESINSEFANSLCLSHSTEQKLSIGGAAIAAKEIMRFAVE